MQRINYNFEDLENAMSKLKQNPSANALKDIKTELNKFYKDSTCKEVIYTHNTDKMFFGMSVMPEFTTDTVKRMICTNDRIRLSNYYVEIDSKLLDLGLSTKELTAVILHEVGHMVNDATPLDDISNGLNIHLASKGDNLKRISDIEFKELMIFSIKNSVQKLYSLFQFKNEEVIADQFVVACGYGKDLESAVKKIIRSTGTINKGVNGKLAIIQWSLRIYKELGLRRLPAIKTLRKIYEMSPSELEKRSLRRVINVLEKPMQAQYFQEGVNFIDKMLDKTSSAYKSFKYHGMRGLEDDLYEYSMRVENVDKEDDALVLLRGINLRMAMIDDYIIERNKHLSESEKQRWFDLKNKYHLLREELGKKKTYADKYYGLFINTPVVSSRYEA